MKKRANFIELIRLWGVIFLIGIGVSIIAIDVIGSYRDFNSRADQMRKDYISHQKQIIKQEVNRVVDMISHEKEQSGMLTRSKIKSRVYEAYAIAQNIYRQNKTAKTEAEIQKMILDALRPIRFENGSGYYFIIRMDGDEVLFADQPKMD
jgi:two-component system cell cycle sensor histidine kinase/response regulator CckA